MSTIVLPFSPQPNSETYISVTPTSTPTLLKNGATGAPSMELINRSATEEVFLKFGTTAATTTAVVNQGYILRGNDRIVISRPTDGDNGWLYVDAVCAATKTANIVIILGWGS